MNLLTRDTDYAMRSIRYIAQHKGRVIAVGELCRELKIARPFLRAILQKLHHSGILKAVQGRNGGFALRKNADSITLLDVMCVFQGNEGFLHCRTSGKDCHNIPVCPLRKRLKEIEKDLFTALSAITVGSLLNKI